MKYRARPGENAVGARSADPCGLSCAFVVGGRCSSRSARRLLGSPTPLSRSEDPLLGVRSRHPSPPHSAAFRRLLSCGPCVYFSAALIAVSTPVCALVCTLCTSRGAGVHPCMYPRYETAKQLEATEPYSCFPAVLGSPGAAVAPPAQARARAGCKQLDATQGPALTRLWASGRTSQPASCHWHPHHSHPTGYRDPTGSHGDPSESPHTGSRRIRRPGPISQGPPQRPGQPPPQAT